MRLTSPCFEQESQSSSVDGVFRVVFLSFLALDPFVILKPLVHAESVNEIVLSLLVESIQARFL